MKIKIKLNINRIIHDPYIGWTILLVFAFILTVALVIFGIYTYRNMNNSLSESGGSIHQDQKEIFDTNVFERLLKDYNKKATDHASLIKAYSGPGDPSI
ncbi:MAG: hypothetical protein WCW03_01110 [Candidatus Paceibacterota bacterium]|jgi:hypothetical protein